MVWNPNPIIPDDNYVKLEQLENAQECMIRAKNAGGKIKINVSFFQKLLNEIIRRRYLEPLPATLSSSLTFISKVPSNDESGLYSSDISDSDSDIVSDSSTDLEVTNLEQLDTSSKLYKPKKSFYEQRQQRHHIFAKNPKKNYWAEGNDVRQLLTALLLITVVIIMGILAVF
jgi:hypothetical protein